jgi:dihydroorotate dehydrogenase
LFCFDAEGIHDFIVSAGKAVQGIAPLGYLARKACRDDEPRLKTQVFNLSFDNPVGLAAGFDKNAELINFFYDLGFGFIEVGSLSAKPSKGNDKPRIFRLIKEKAIINNMGLPNKGTDQVILRLTEKRAYPVGINISQSSNNTMPLDCVTLDCITEDIAYAFSKAALVADYIALNISCPNVKEGKTFENPYALDNLLAELKKRNDQVPLLIKLSPDLPRQDLEELISACSKHSIEGYVISNARSIQHNDMQKGLSGLPMQKISTELIRRVYQLTNGKVPIVGVGGIDSAASAYEKIKAGASLIQIYTGLIYYGPGIVKKINQGLIDLVERDRFSNISEAVGKSA